MPGLVPGIHVFASLRQGRRGWPGQARQMTKTATYSQSHDRNAVSAIKNLICHHADAFGRMLSCRVACCSSC